MLIFNILLGLVIYGTSIYYLFFDNATLLVKDIASFLFVLLGIINILWNYKKHTKKDKLVNVFVFLGLLFGFFGDIMLNKLFLVGGVLFTVGHLFYIVAFLVVQEFSIKDFAISLITIGITLVIVFMPKELNFASYLPIVAIYAMIIAVMFAKAICNVVFAKQKSIQSILMLVGAILFYFSDAMLMIYNFGVFNPIYFKLCILTYYPAQILFAISMAKYKN